MRYLLVAALLFSCVITCAQKPSKLKDVYGDAEWPKNDAIFYGDFIGRPLKFMNRGEPHIIYLKNVDSQEAFYFNAQTGSGKSGIFCCRLKPGEYEITRYRFSSDRLFTILIHTESVYKNIDVTDSLTFKQHIKNGDTLQHFRLKVEAGKVYYTGTWDFSKPIANFADEKTEADGRFKLYFELLDFSKAITQLPHTE